MKKEPNDLHEYTVQEFLITLCGLLKNKQIKETDKLIISSDEEGNSFSGVCWRGLEVDQESGIVTLFPLWMKEYEEIEKEIKNAKR